MVVKEPRNPIIKKKYIGDDLLAINPATHPIIKQPSTFTESVPKGIRLEIYCLYNLLTKTSTRLQAPLL